MGCRRCEQKGLGVGKEMKREKCVCKKVQRTHDSPKPVLVPQTFLVLLWSVNCCGSVLARCLLTFLCSRRLQFGWEVLILKALH